MVDGRQCVNHGARVGTFDGIPLVAVFVEAVRIAQHVSGLSDERILFRLHLRVDISYRQVLDPVLLQEPEVVLLLEGLCRMVPIGPPPEGRAA